MTTAVVCTVDSEIHQKDITVGSSCIHVLFCFVCVCVLSVDCTARGQMGKGTSSKGISYSHAPFVTGSEGQCYVSC